LHYFARLCSGGWGGVDIFFALSGFLVGGILLDGRDQPRLLRIFLTRRAVRILPLYFAVLATFYLARFLMSQSAWLFAGAVPWWSYVTLTQNFAMPIVESNAFYLGPTWSLAVEAQIYLLLGFTLIRAPLKMSVALMVAGVVLAEACRVGFWMSGHHALGYFILPARIDGACCGVLAAVAVRSDRALAVLNKGRRWIWLAVLALFATTEALSSIGHGFGSPGAAIYSHLALSVASSLTIALLVSNPQGKINRLLRFTPFVALGTISYGVYLLHIPVIGLTHALMGRHSIVPDSWSGAAATAIGLVTTVLLARLSWRWFEKPLNDYAHRITRMALRAP